MGTDNKVKIRGSFHGDICPEMTQIKIFLSLLLLINVSSKPSREVISAVGLGTIQRISILTSDCENCGMTLLGQVNLKICGGAPEPCCSIVNIADFDSDMFNEGQIDNYTGEYQLEGCFNYNLSSDGGQLDWVEVTTERTTIRCPLGFWMDLFSSVTAEGCVEVVRENISNMEINN